MKAFHGSIHSIAFHILGSLGLQIRVHVWIHFRSSYWSTSLYSVLLLVQRESRSLEISMLDMLDFIYKIRNLSGFEPVKLTCDVYSLNWLSNYLEYKWFIYFCVEFKNIFILVLNFNVRILAVQPRFSS